MNEGKVKIGRIQSTVKRHLSLRKHLLSRETGSGCKLRDSQKRGSGNLPKHGSEEAKTVAGFSGQK